MRFTDLGLSPEILRALEAQGYTSPTPIQSKAIPAVLAGHDVMACAQTGTGKTAGFTLPILQRLQANSKTRATSRSQSGAGPRVLILAPARGLAAPAQACV